MNIKEMSKLEILNENNEEMVLIIEPQSTLYRIEPQQTFVVHAKYFGKEARLPESLFALELFKRKIILYHERFTHIDILVEPNKDEFSKVYMENFDL
jgi:hypothetical protein